MVCCYYFHSLDYCNCYRCCLQGNLYSKHRWLLYGLKDLLKEANCYCFHYYYYCYLILNWLQFSMKIFCNNTVVYFFMVNLCQFHLKIVLKITIYQSNLKAGHVYGLFSMVKCQVHLRFAIQLMVFSLLKVIIQYL